MTSAPFHALFVLILVGTLAARERGRDLLTEPTDMSSAVVRIAAIHGLTYRGIERSPDEDAEALSFDAPGCARPVQIAPLNVSLEQGLLLEYVGSPGDSRRYAYIDRSWAKPRRFAVFWVRLRYAMLALIGQTRYVPGWHMLLIDSPSGCHAAETIDWRLAWDRDFLTSSPRIANPSPP